MTKQYKHNNAFTFEPETYRIILDEKEIKLSHKETMLLEMLCDNSQRVVERKKILDEIWGETESRDISLNKNILLLRRKFESIGVFNSIETIPRVGYIFKLQLEVTHGDELSHREDVSINDESIDDIDTEKEHLLFGTGKLIKYKLVFLFVTAFIILTITLLYLEIVKNERAPELKKLEQIKTLSTSSMNRVIMYTEDVSSPAVYSYIDSFINKDRNFYALISKYAFSYLDVNLEDNIVWQKTFFIDDRINLKDQLECIAENINQEIVSPVDVHDIPGMSFVRLRFYRPCNIKADYIGHMLIKITGIDDESINQATWAQDFTFKNAEQKTIFHISKVSRAHFYENGIKYLENKSLNVAAIEQDILQQDHHIYTIFDRFTRDYVYLRTIKKNEGVHVTNIFGGLLFYTRIFKDENEEI